MFNVGDREFVIPGQLIGDNVYCTENCLSVDDKIYSSIQGMVRVNGNRGTIIPLSGAYTPKRDDIVIGLVVEVLGRGWLVDINSPYMSVMMGEEATKNVMEEDLSLYYDVGDKISVKIIRVNEVYNFDLIRPRKLNDGFIINVNPKRIPRVVGKRRSMLEILRKKTGCNIVVGQNGRIWIKSDKPDNAELAVKAIKKIEREAQTSGLTNKIESMLDDEWRK
ncbi:MAG: exosome complex RNA-binding protein Rrp4 [Candidatus Altiarchaeota archaeon]|nr:exosome complex RNA-binding protein Rrp4 [Candidatus Altiarchaeota archaeon]